MVFDENLWQSYVAYLLAMDENPFSMICETVGASEDGTVNSIVKKIWIVFTTFSTMISVLCRRRWKWTVLIY